jgi:3-oxoacyl-[acyl-carrier protein] reductase
VPRVALITGGARGLGLAAAQALARDGLTVAVADLDLQVAAVSAAGLPGDRHGAFAVDVQSENSVGALFDAVEDTMGPVCVLATFAGILISDGETRVGIADSKMEDWDRTFAVNARGTFLCLREMLRRRREVPVEHGRIITVSSLAAQVGGVRGSAPYSASKGAVLTLTKTAASEGGPYGLTANAIAPGMIDTAMLRQVLPTDSEAASVASFPLRRIGQPGEIGATVAFLASEDAGFITGATIDVNGGQLLR